MANRTGMRDKISEQDVLDVINRTQNRTVAAATGSSAHGGSGTGGMVTEQDVLDVIQGKKTRKTQSTAKNAAAGNNVAASPVGGRTAGAKNSALQNGQDEDSGMGLFALWREKSRLANERSSLTSGTARGNTTPAVAQALADIDRQEKELPGFGEALRNSYENWKAQKAEPEEEEAGDTEQSDAEAVQRSALERLWLDASGLLQQTAGSYQTLGEMATDPQVWVDIARDVNVRESERAQRELSGRLGPETDAALQTLAERARADDEANPEKVYTPENSAGVRRFMEGSESIEQALEGMKGPARFAAETANSVVSNAPNMALAAIPVVGTALSLGTMGIQAAGGRAAELSSEGNSAADTLGRAIASGAIEIATESVPVGNWAEILRGNGKSAVRNILTQMGEEGTEEAVSYLANYAADLAAQDPNAHFSLEELLESAGMGAASGGIYGGVGVGINRLAALRGGRQQAAESETGDGAAENAGNESLPAPHPSAQSADTFPQGGRQDGAAETGAPGGTTPAAQVQAEEAVDRAAAQMQQAATQQAQGQQAQQAALAGMAQQTAARAALDPQGLAEQIEAETDPARGTMEPEAVREAEQRAATRGGPYEETEREALYRQYMAQQAADRAEQEAWGGDAAAQEEGSPYVEQMRQAVAAFADGKESYTEEMKQAITAGYKGQSPTVYVQAVNGMYDAGRTGSLTYEQALAANRTAAQAVNDPALLYRAWALGENSVKGAAVTDAPLGAAERGGAVTYGEGVDAGGTQVPAEVLDAVAQRFGIDVEVVQQLTDGEGQEVNGHFAAGMARLTLGENSSNGYQALVHELTHYMGSANPEGWARLKNRILTFYAGEVGMNAAQSRVLDRYAESYGGAAIGADEAARGLWEGVFSSEDNMRAFLEYLSEDETTAPAEKRSILQTLRDILDRVIEHLRGLLRGGNGTAGAAEGRRLAEQAETAEQCRAMVDEFLQELETARQNNTRQTEARRGEGVQQNAAERTAASEDVRFSVSDEYAGLEAKMIRAIPSLKNDAPVCMLTVEDGWKPGENAFQYEADFFNSIGGKVEREGFGTVLMERKSARNDIGHKYGPAKMATVRSIPHVIKNGKLIDTQQNWKGRGLKTYVFMAPVTLIEGGKERRTYVAAIVREQNQKNADKRFYVHEVLDADGNRIVFDREADNKRDTHFKTRPYTDESVGTGDLMGTSDNTIAETGEDVKQSRPVTDQGERYSRDVDGDEDIGDDAEARTRLERENRELAWEISRMEEQLEALYKQRKKLGGRVITQNAVKNAVTRLLVKYESRYDKATMTREVKALFESIANTPDISVDEAMETCVNLMRDVLRQSVRTNTDGQEYYAPIRERLRGTTIEVQQGSAIYHDLLDAFGDGENGRKWGNVRKAVFGRLDLRLVQHAGNADTFFAELAEQYPATFDADADIVDNVQSALAVFEASKPMYENIYGMDLDTAAAAAGQELFAEYLHTPEWNSREEWQKREREKMEQEFRGRLRDALTDQRAGYEAAIKAARKNRSERIARLQAKIRSAESENRVKDAARYRRQLEKYRTDTDDKALRVQAIYANRETRRMEDRRRSAARTAVNRQVKRLNRWLMAPTNQAYIQDKQKKAVLDLLTAFDWNTARPDNKRAEARWQEALGGLATVAEQMKNKVPEGWDYVDFDPDLPDMIKALLDSTKNRKAQDFNYLQMEMARDILETVAHSITNANKLLVEGQRQSLTEAATAAIGEMEEMQSRQVRERNTAVGRLWNKLSDTKVVDELVGLTGVETMDAGRFFARLGPTAQGLYQNLRDAFNRRIHKLRDFKAAWEKATKEMKVDKKTLDKWTGEKAEKHTFTLTSGENIELTAGQVMELYCLTQREQAKLHLTQGGILFKNGARGGEKPTHLTATDIANMTGVLTPKQVRFCDWMQQYLSTDVAAWGNEATMRQYGVRKFTEGHYWPISSEKNMQRLTDASAANGSVLRGMYPGFAEQTVRNANTALYLHDAIDTFIGHGAAMATYAEMGLAQGDLLRWYNWKEADNSASVQRALEGVFGKKGKNYFAKFMMDVTGTQSQGYEDSLNFGGLTRNWKVAKVAFNFRVAIQQPTAYLRAMAVLDPGSMISGASKLPFSAATHEMRRAKTLMRKYCGIALWKDWGFFESSISTDLKTVITGQETWYGKVQDFSTGLAEVADRGTWEIIWLACEADVKKRQPGLKFGSEEFNRAVGKRMSEVVDKTQVVDSVFHRSQIMRSDNWLKRTATNFMNEPIKTWNLVRDAVVELAQAKGKEDVRAKRKQLARVLAVTSVNALATAFAAAVLDGARELPYDDDEEKEAYTRWQRYWRNYVEAAIGYSADDETLREHMDSILASNLVGNLNLFENIPFIKDVLAIAQGEDILRNDTESFEEAWDAVTGIINYLQGKGTKSRYGIAYKAAAAVSDLTGIAVGSLLREAKSIYDLATDDPLRLNEPGNLLKDMVMFGNAKGANELLKGLVEKKLEKDHTVAPGEAVSNVRTNITKLVKPRYLAADDAERAKLQNTLLKLAYKGKDGEALHVYEMADLNGWLNDIDRPAWKEAMQKFDLDAAQRLTNTLMERKLAEGKEKDDAVDSLRSDITETMKPMYMEGNEETRQEIEKLLLNLKAGGETVYDKSDLNGWLNSEDRPEFVAALQKLDVDKVKSIADVLVGRKVAEGKDKDEAIGDIKSTMTETIKPMYVEGSAATRAKMEKSILKLQAGGQTVYDKADLNGWLNDIDRPAWKEAMQKFDLDTAQRLTDTLMDRKMSEGKDAKKAASDLKKTVTETMKPMYLEGDEETRREIENLLLNLEFNGTVIYDQKDLDKWLK